MSKIFRTKLVSALLLCTHQMNKDNTHNVLPGMKAPDFAGSTWCNDSWNDVQLSDYSGKWLILFFYPMDFGYIAPSELMALEEKRTELASIGCDIIGVSTDSALVHHAFEGLQSRF